MQVTFWSVLEGEGLTPFSKDNWKQFLVFYPEFGIDASYKGNITVKTVKVSTLVPTGRRLQVRGLVQSSLIACCHQALAAGGPPSGARCKGMLTCCSGADLSDYVRGQSP